MPKHLLAFKIGSPQAFIESARTLRDLWTGSYLISWLTAAAMKPVIVECGYDSILTPHVNESNPMLRAMLQGEKGNDKSTLPNLPNTFTAEVHEDKAKAKALSEKCIQTFRAEWDSICNHVKDAIHNRFAQEDPKWYRSWDAQVSTYFDVQCVIRPMPDIDPNTKAWTEEWKCLRTLMEMVRSVRHVPDYKPIADGDYYPVKCSLLGTFEQMGPGNLDNGKTFWKHLSTPTQQDRQAKTPTWEGLHGTRLQRSDRLCAISLVKRFAWPAFFARTNDRDGVLGVRVDALRYSDTASLAATSWLSEFFLDDESKVRNWRTLKHWSGQWLHWHRHDQDDDDKACPQKLLDAIRIRKRAKGNPPLYYALVHLDVDSMEEFFTAERGLVNWGLGKERYRTVTTRISTFALGKVQTIVESKHEGELIYSGGDDILALLPLHTAIACVQELRGAFCASDCMTKEGSISGGIAVVHYKEDLRFALHQVREAERKAKSIGRTINPKEKNALALTICRRSGEHTTVVMGWEQTSPLQNLVNDFRGKASDRWAYKLRAELPTLQGLPKDEILKAGRAETLRLVGRADAATQAFTDHITRLFDSYRDEMTRTARKWDEADILEGFVILCQSASFLARGRD